MGEARKEQVLIRLTKKERMQLQVLADLEGETITDYVRALIANSYYKKFAIGYSEMADIQSDNKVLTESEKDEKYGISVWSNPAFSGINGNKRVSVFSSFESASG